MSILSTISELIFPTPRICPFCNKKMDTLMVCEECRLKLVKYKQRLGQCRRCGSFGSPTKVCDNCRTWPQYIKYNIAVVPYENRYREVLHRLKFRKQGWLTPALVDLMIDFFPWEEEIDLIIPVPLHKNRLRERGFNQSALLARELARRTNLSQNTGVLLRQLDTPHQTGLDISSRRTNLLDAFIIADNAEIEGKSILLIDDTLTTGTTFFQCAKTLHKGGAKYIYGLTFAAGIK